MPSVFIGDEAYPLLDNLLKPYSGENLDPDTVYFNRRLSRARKTIECAFGILFSKWRIFSKAIETTEKTVDKIVKVVCFYSKQSSFCCSTFNNASRSNVLDRCQALWGTETRG